ncbi:PREDICTED: rho GDP-dissociation inhibitor 1-like [Amphimedon queenslandica]|nr:PREDICTED: rho GDP-dissociation inhibitor 1-like [Amphimedon queenslandica]|eukprot:XP_003390370.1 PREDICTED: rho GDP-dissociation inhibitor 1-like [Amphimedon queenslandica]
MAEGADQAEQLPPEVPEGEEDETTPGYKAPKKVDLQTIQQMDADDESLVKYKQQLLGQTAGILDEGGSNVLLKQMIIAPEGRDEITLDLTGDLSKFKKNPVVIKEGTQYRLKIVFRVQREIVSGLRYNHGAFRKGIKVDKSNLMVGSYGPKTEAHVFTTPVEDAPSGMLARGDYTIKSKFTDDDKNPILEWEWVLKIAKDWEK